MTSSTTKTAQERCIRWLDIKNSIGNIGSTAAPGELTNVDKRQRREPTIMGA